MSESEVELRREISRLHREYTDKYSSTKPITNRPAPTFDGAAAEALQKQIKKLEAQLKRLRNGDSPSG
jgi:hypothetical protein